MATRVPFVAGNWKMNLNRADGTALATGLVRAGLPSSVEVAVIPPAIYLESIEKAIVGSSIQLGAQNCWYEKSGAFTGEISPQMLKEFNVQHVLVGHSERRHVCGETDIVLNKKAQAAIAEDLTVIFCVGETLEQRQAYKTVDVVGHQMTAGLAHLGERAAKEGQLVIAYEPVWAIGTGQNATAEQAQEVHAFIRSHLGSMFGADVAAMTRIQYGGSVKASNAQAILSQPDVDGALVGGASLHLADFVAIVKAAAQAKHLPM